MESRGVVKESIPEQGKIYMLSGRVTESITRRRFTHSWSFNQKGRFGGDYRSGDTGVECRADFPKRSIL